jgi:hypothetical protein
MHVPFGYSRDDFDREQGHRLRDDLSTLIERAAHALASTIEHVRVDHPGFQVSVFQQLLNGPDVVSVLKQVGCEAMAKSVRPGPLRDAGLFALSNRCNSSRFCACNDEVG